MYLSCFCLSVSVSLSEPSLGLSTKISHCHTLRLSFSFSLCQFCLHLPYLFLLSSTVLCRPLSHSLFLTVHAFAGLFLCMPRSASCLPLLLFVCGSLSLYKSLTLPPFLLCLSLSFSLSPCVSPDIHVEIFSHVRYRFTTPARSLWPLNLIPSTKPHCFLCIRSVVCDCGYAVCMVCVFRHYRVEAGYF